MKKLIIFDKDGTLVSPKSGEKFVNSPEGQILLPGAFDRVKGLVDQGAIAVIASNQGGVAAGHKSIQEAIAEIQFCLDLLEGLIDTAFFCPDFEGQCLYAVGPKDPDHPRLENYCSFSGSNFRKPGPGMLNFAMQQYPEIKKLPNFNPQDCLMVGDRPEDQEAAIASEIDFVWAADWRND